MASKIYDIWCELDATSLMNDKLSILKDNKDNEILKKWLLYVYNPYYNYGIRGIPDDVWDKIDNSKILPDPKINDKFFGLLDDLRYRGVTGNLAKELVSNFCIDNGQENAELLNAVLTRTLDVNVSVKTINKVWDNLIPEFKISKAEPATEDNIQYPCIAETKMNGVRVIAEVSKKNIIIYSSNGNTVQDNCLINLKGNLKALLHSSGLNSFVIDGELTSDNRRGVSGVFNKALKGTLEEKEELSSNLVYTLFDILPFKDWRKQRSSYPQKVRTLQLKELFKRAAKNNFIPDSIKMIETKEVYTSVEISELYTRVYNSGGEGLIIKQLESHYTFTRSQSWLKIKSIKEADLEILGFTEGTGKRSNLIGAIECQSKDGDIKVSVGSGLNDQDLEYFTKNKNKLIGKIITVEYNEIIKNKEGQYSLFLPRFIEIRNDKTEADDFNKILSESNGGEL